MQYNLNFRKLYRLGNESSLQEFKRMLEESGASKTTVKNYLSDIRSFLTNEEPNKNLSYATIKRRNSAIKKYLFFKNSKKNTYLPFVFTFFGLFAISVLTFNSNLKNNKDVLADNSQPNIDLPSDTTINGTQGSISDRELKLTVKLEPQVSDYNLPTTVNFPLESKAISTPSNGYAVIAGGSKEALIVNSLINSNSYIYLTPYGPTDRQVLYVKNQDDGFAIVAIEESLGRDLKFQWKVDNTEVYHSIY